VSRHGLQSLAIVPQPTTRSANVDGVYTLLDIMRRSRYGGRGMWNFLPAPGSRWRSPAIVALGLSLGWATFYLSRTVHATMVVVLAVIVIYDLRKR
jgi:hypothetical protein